MTEKGDCSSSRGLMGGLAAGWSSADGGKSVGVSALAGAGVTAGAGCVSTGRASAAEDSGGGVGLGEFSVKFGSSWGGFFFPSDSSSRRFVLRQNLMARDRR